MYILEYAQWLTNPANANTATAVVLSAMAVASMATALVLRYWCRPPPPPPPIQNRRARRFHLTEEYYDLYLPGNAAMFGEPDPMLEEDESTV